MRLVIWLYFQFFKIGLFAVGGGLATLPFLSDLGRESGLFTIEQLMNILAVSESTPGPIGINMATYVGYDVMGIFGGIITTFGIVTPSVIVIELVCVVMDKFRDSPVVDRIFKGLKPASMGLICMSAVEVIRNSLFNEEISGIADALNIKAVIFALILFVLMKKIKIHPVFFVLISAVVGVVIGF